MKRFTSEERVELRDLVSLYRSETSSERQEAYEIVGRVQSRFGHGTPTTLVCRTMWSIYHWIRRNMPRVQPADIDMSTLSQTKQFNTL